MQRPSIKNLDAPEFTKNIIFSAYTEGWSVFWKSSQRYGLINQNPMPDFGRLADGMWRDMQIMLSQRYHTNRVVNNHRLLIAYTPNPQNIQ